MKRRPIVPLAPMIAVTVPKFYASTMMLASGLWIADMAVAVIAETDKPAVSVANTGRSGAEWRSIMRMVIVRGTLVMTSVEKHRTASPKRIPSGSRTTQLVRH